MTDRATMKPVWKCPRCGSWIDASSTGNLIAHSMVHYDLTSFLAVGGPNTRCPDCGLPMKDHTEGFQRLMRRRGEA